MKLHEDIAGMALELGRLIRKEMSAGDGDKQSPIRMHALSFIEDHPGTTMKEFASLMKISPSTATMFVDKLVRSKLARRSADKDNRKIVRLHLTPQGSKTMSIYRKHKQAALRRIFAGLSAVDRKELERIFTKVLQNPSTPSHD